MKLPTLRGLIDRRILANYRVDPDRLTPLLPAPLRPKLFANFGVAGICLIRLKHVRPAHVPAVLGLTSENAAHRIAVEWDDEHGQTREGVYIPRRDTSSRLNVLAGGRVFTGVHHHARFDVRETPDTFHVALDSDDGDTHVRIDADLATALPQSSIFPDLAAASDFFRAGSLGYSASDDDRRLDALELRTADWQVEPLAVRRVESSFFDDAARFPAGSIRFDCALLMRGVRHEWHEREPMCVGCAPAPAPVTVQAMRDPDDLFAALAKSTFRHRFRLTGKDLAYAREHGLAALLDHARNFVRDRLAPAVIPNDGKQTPMRNHPVFVAQHATATCCRGCLQRWHAIPAGHDLTDHESAHVVNAIARWLRAQGVGDAQGNLFT